MSNEPLVTEFGISKAMVRRAVDHGHKRAAKDINKWSARRKKARAERKEKRAA